MLGKFYLFRPSSLILLLWLALVVAWLSCTGLPNEATAKSLALVLILPPFLLNLGNRIVGRGGLDA